MGHDPRPLWHHAGRTTRLVALREQFVAIYSQDWLEKTRQTLIAAHPHVDIPATPERGSFDLNKVLEAELFFLVT
jgi:DNA-directed RNA polymerase